MGAMRPGPLAWLVVSAALATPAAAGDDDAAARAALAAKLPGVQADDLRRSPVPGLYEVTIGNDVMYVSPDGRYLLRGDLLDLAARVNLTEAREAEIRARWVAALDESRMVIFEPAGDTRHTITVFTDIDCTYCRAMHAEIDDYLARGIRVRYLLYPRNGPGTASAAKAEHVWCSPDRNDALTRAKAGKPVRAPSCETPIMANLQTGRTLPVTGTPTTVTDSGHLISGFVPPDRLQAELQRLAGGAGR